MDKGLGDTTEKIIKLLGLDKFAPTDCNCNKRKQYLNEKFPYKK